MAFVNNFSTSFRWCDRLFGTDDKYLEYRKKIDAAKKSGVSDSELAAIELKMAQEAEKEGVEAEKVAENYAYGSKVKVQ